MLKKGTPQDLEDLVQFLELEESAERATTAKAKAQNNNGNQHGKQAGSNKRKGNSGQNGGSLKKAKKHCDLCDKKHGGLASSHNTNECRIYRSDGSKKGQSCGEKKSNHSFAQLEKKLDKTEKRLTKMSKKMDRLVEKSSKEETESDSDA